MSATARDVRHQSGIAAILLLFAMSSFAVLTIGALSTELGAAAAGRALTLFRSFPEDAFLKFVAPLVVPEDWRTENAKGAYAFTLPVIVPETGSDEAGSTSAWHTLTEVPGMAVCCEARAGACNDRHKATGGAPIADWTPGAEDALRLSFALESRPDSAADPSRGDVVSATVTSAPAAGAASTSLTRSCRTCSSSLVMTIRNHVTKNFDTHCLILFVIATLTTRRCRVSSSGTAR